MKYDNDGNEREIIIPSFAADAFAGRAKFERYLKLKDYVEDTQASLNDLKKELNKDFSSASEKISAQLERFALEHRPKLIVERYEPVNFAPPIVHSEFQETNSQALEYTSLSRYFAIEGKATEVYLLFQELKVETNQWEQFHLLAYRAKPKQESLLVRKVKQKIEEGKHCPVDLEEATVGIPMDGVIFFPAVLFSLYAQIDWSGRQEKNEKLALCNLSSISDYRTFAERDEHGYPVVFSSDEERLRIKQLITSLAGKSLI
ncbi:hypothetical protein J4437_03680 [Candidatus Woesearchaeota archaeon]|nr:hypothetical protein [Candidatus Woesearchaeota archaeon]